MGDWVEPGKERYGLNWPGKADCMKVIQAPSVATLKPDRNESVDFDTTENLFIEGDNLEVLKLLQKAYFGKVKMIYIDPPYNTGKEFIYPDKYQENLDTYLAYTGQVDDEGKKFSTNTDAGGRFHSNWNSMMYPRLYLARNLLKEDGVIIISIDDNELENLKKICSEIFGEENFIANFVWEKSRKNDAKFVSVGHEYAVVYAKSLGYLKESKTVWREEKPGSREIWDKYLQLREMHGDNDGLIETEIQEWFSNLPNSHPSKKWARYRRIDKNGPWRDRDISWPGGDGPDYDVIHPKTGKPCKVPERGWGYSTPEEMQRQIDLGLIVFRADHTEPPFRKVHIRPIPDQTDADDAADDDEEVGEAELATQVRGSYFYKQSQVAIKYMRSLMGSKVFDNPKDHEEIFKLIKYVIGVDNEIVLDFFCGSGSTAHAVMQLNSQSNAAHKYIMVQLPEPNNPKERTGKAALKLGLNTVVDIAKERIRRAAKRISEERVGELDLSEKRNIDLGFRVFKLASSNFKIWDGDADRIDNLSAQLELHVDHIDQASSPEDILYELLLKAGFELTTKVEKQTMAGKDVYAVADGALLVCLDKEITPALIDALADANPLQVICLDEGFKGNDQLKTNAVQTFKSRAKEDEEAIVFRTV